MNNSYLEVDGKQLKNLPLNVAVYIRTYGANSNSYLSIYKKEIDKYIAETNWIVTASYFDQDRSGLYMSDSDMIMELMQNNEEINDLRESRFDPNYFVPYDMVVTFNIGHISTYEMYKNCYFESDFPTFFIDSEKLASLDPMKSLQELIKRAKINNPEDCNLIDYYCHNIDSSNSDADTADINFQDDTDDGDIAPSDINYHNDVSGDDYE